MCTVVLLTISLLQLLAVGSFAPNNQKKSHNGYPFELKMSDSSSSRQPWDFGRFVSQSSKFVPLPFGQKSSKAMIRPGDILWSPSSSETDFSFAPLDDVVMGGVSSSDFDDNTGLWTGSVTDANNGGFVGVRSTPLVSWDMSGCKGIQLKLRHGAKTKQRFKVGLRDSPDFNGILWTTSFDLGGNNFLASENKKAVTTVKIPLDQQVPTRFARIVPDQKFLDSNVVGIQLVYSKFEYDGDLNPNFAVGDVDLQVLEIGAY